MTVSFECANCGKSFVVDASFAGKRGRCKQCGTVNRIPLLAEPVEPPDAGIDRFGFDDGPAAPLPRLTRRPADADSAVSVPARPRKKKVGFFAKAPKSRNSTSAGQKGAWGATFGALVAIAIFGGRFALEQGYIGGFGLWSRSAVEQSLESMVLASENCVSVLRTIHDEASARSAEPQVVASLRKIADVLRDAKGKKAKKTAIEAANAKYEARLIAAGRSLQDEFTRVASIPGARLALLGIMGPATEIDQLTQSLRLEAGVNPQPFSAPRFSQPPPMPAPTMVGGNMPTMPPPGGFGPGGPVPTPNFGGPPGGRFGPRFRMQRIGPPSP